MREIKFKAKRKDNQEWVWVYGSLLILESGYYIVPIGTFHDEISLMKDCDVNAIWEGQDYFEVIPETICQYINETDSHGHELYWNDEIVVPELNNRRIIINHKGVFSIIQNFIEQGTDFYYLKNIYDKEVK